MGSALNLWRGGKTYKSNTPNPYSYEPIGKLAPKIREYVDIVGKLVPKAIIV
jgi:hypothetical protein